MRKNALFAVACSLFLGCAATTAAGGGNYDARNNNMITSKRGPINDQELVGVWNDVAEATIALVHREGEELRMIVAVGDIRPNIPLTMFEVTDMGNRLSTPEERAKAKEALTTWRSGAPTPKDRYLWALAGKNVGVDVAQGAWADGNAGCETSSYWGNFTAFLQKDKNGAPVLMLTVMASKKKFGGGVGGQDFEFSRIMYFEKSAKPIPPALLDQLKKSENFCRKTAAE
jgi:hypothetical protein